MSLKRLEGEKSNLPKIKYRDNTLRRTKTLHANWKWSLNVQKIHLFRETESQAAQGGFKFATLTLIRWLGQDTWTGQAGTTHLSLFFFPFSRLDLLMLPRLVSNSWVQVGFLPQSPNTWDYRPCVTTPGFVKSMVLKQEKQPCSGVSCF